VWALILDDNLPQTNLAGSTKQSSFLHLRPGCSGRNTLRVSELGELDLDSALRGQVATSAVTCINVEGHAQRGMRLAVSEKEYARSTLLTCLSEKALMYTTMFCCIHDSVLLLRYERALVTTV
jgi:hypothetical protein